MPKLLEDFIVEDSPIEGDNLPVPNVQPSIKNVPYKLAIIGEAPGADEIREGKPFVGYSGKFLNGLLSKAGILRDACFIGNICQHRPPGNDITHFSREGKEFQEGLAALNTHLKEFNPNICLLLGKTALWAAKGVDNIGDWRGSLFLGEKEPFIGRKCIAAYHPAACLRQYEWTPLLSFDIKKAYNESTTPTLILPERQLIIDLDAEGIVQQLERILVAKPLVSLDIEGYIDAMSCLSIATSDSFSFIIPFSTTSNENHFDPESESRIWLLLSRLLADPTIPKVLQNSLYDRFVLQYSYNIVIAGVVDDTMLKHHELYCELEKSLGFQASLYTHEPFYKSDRKTSNVDVFWRYCCRDSAVTYEINSKLDKWLDTPSRQHYQFNVALLNPILYMELRGIRYDSAAARHRQEEITDHVFSLQHDLNAATNFGFPEQTTRGDILTAIQNEICFKRDRNAPKKGHEDDYRFATNLLLKGGPLTKSERGRLSVIAKRDLNIKGAAFKKLLYETLNLPKQKHPITGELTSNYEALLKLKKHSSHPSLQLSIDLGELRTRSQMLSISADSDGRIRCGYNIVGTETGRLTCYTSPTGSGYNLQTIPSEQQSKPLEHPLRQGMRDLFIADDGYYLFQCDLSGADGWTVAARLASLGDRTMLDDYLAGIKPAKVLCYLLRHGATSLAGKTREEIKELTKSIEKESWDYFASKIGQHGTCYLMGKRKLATQVFIQSEGEITITENEAHDLQRLFSVRYRVKIWHDWMTRHLSKQTYPPKLTSASGHTRRFFGRSQEILGEALAHEPQANTTYATNLAAYKLWTDPENRVGNKLRVEPLHQVHDALVGQFKIEDTAWSVDKIKRYFANEIVISGIPITIPFEGTYGTNWAFDEKSKIGSI